MHIVDEDILLCPICLSAYKGQEKDGYTGAQRGIGEDEKLAVSAHKPLLIIQLPPSRQSEGQMHAILLSVETSVQFRGPYLALAPFSRSIYPLVVLGLDSDTRGVLRRENTTKEA
jgi:hypothetical protein